MVSQLPINFNTKIIHKAFTANSRIALFDPVSIYGAKRMFTVLAVREVREKTIVNLRNPVLSGFLYELHQMDESMQECPPCMGCRE